MRFTAFLVILIFGCIECFPQFASKIPNGHGVPNPCPTPAVWTAVGHYSPTKHTVKKNPFAKDFKAHNLTWTRELCGMDSDKDGMTNGEELGDPGCKWTVGTQPELPAKNHPGICEPIDADKCRYQHFKCDCVNDLSLCPNIINSIPLH